MSGVWDWAKSFETQSKQQAESTTKVLESVLAQHERSIVEGLRSSERSISDATDALRSSAVTHVGTIQQVIAEEPLTVWRERAMFVLGMLMAGCLVLLVFLGVSTWWLGLQRGEIEQNRAAIAMLEREGGKVDLRMCRSEPAKRLCVAVVTDETFKTDSGQTYMVVEGY